jgi:DNA polymerase V
MQEDEQQPGDVRVHAGFPNPATDKNSGELDLNRLLIQNTASTFLFRLRGHDWEALGIFDGDVAVIDRVLSPRKNDLVIWWSEHTDHFAISKLQAVAPGATIWGIVTATIHQFRKKEI